MDDGDTDGDVDDRGGVDREQSLDVVVADDDAVVVVDVADVDWLPLTSTYSDVR